MTQLSIAAPAFNEAGCIASVVGSWLDVLDAMDVDGEVVVTNDGSSDRTGPLLDELAERDPRVRPIHLARNAGYGAAMRAAIEAARGEWLVTIDSDGQFSPEDIPRLWALRRPGTAVTGARASKVASASGVVGDRVLRALVRVLLRVECRDPQCALKLIPRSWAANAGISATGITLPTEILARAERDGLEIVEITVRHRERLAGTSKLRLFQTGAVTLAQLIRLRRELRR